MSQTIIPQNVPLQTLHLEHKSGIYFITNDAIPTMDTILLVKIGLAKSKNGLEERLSHYLLCFPRGFYLLGCLLYRSNQVAKQERTIHDYLKSKNRQAEEFQHTRNQEWFYLSFLEVQYLIQMWQKYFPALPNSLLLNNPLLINENYTLSFRKKIKPIDQDIKEWIETFESSPSQHIHTIMKKKNKKEKDEDENEDENEDGNKDENEDEDEDEDEEKINKQLLPLFNNT